MQLKGLTLVKDGEPQGPHAEDPVRSPRAGDGVTGALGRLCREISDELHLLGAVVALMPSVEAHAVAASSAEVARKVEDMQFSMGEGPTRDAFNAQRPVLVADLRADGMGRWPGWAPAACQSGIEAVYAFPLHVGASIFGVLTAYASAGDRLDATGLKVALAFSQAATEVLLDGSIPPGGTQLEPDLDTSLGANSHVYQAQGVVMVEMGVSLSEALARMRAYAWANGQDLAALSRDILAGRAMPDREPR
nr:GAF and ANTAR domain-containing protein [Nocardioides lijunqiniae]